MKITLQLPVPAYLLKYLEFKYGQNYQAKESDWFGLLIISNLEKKRSKYYSFKRPEGNNLFQITVGISKAEKSGYAFHPGMLRKIAKAVDVHFRQELYLHAVANFINQDIPYKQSLQNLLDSYGISEDDLEYDSIRKDFNRNKKQIESKFLK